MKIETLKDRIKKTEEKAVKLNGTIERHQKQLIKKAKVLTDKGIDPNNCDRFDYRQTDTYWDICDYDSKLEDIKNNEKKIQEVNKTLETLKEQLEKQEAKDNENNDLIPEVLNIFLENWKQRCIEFYTVLANEYIELSNKEYEITKEELVQLVHEKRDWKTNTKTIIRDYTDEQVIKILNVDYSEYEKHNIKLKIRYRYINKFNTSHFASDIMVIDKIIQYDKINNTILNKILDDDVKVKKDMFISRIKEVIGEIVDLKGLRITGGEINGIAIGSKCNAKVDTISAGGYNIQCYHYRMLVNIAK